MSDLIHITTLGPGTAVFACLSTVIWITSVMLIIRSPTFRRKWLWGLLTLVNFGFSFSFSLTAEAGEMIRVGVPLGALYVIWFWRSARSTSPQDLQNDASHRTA